MKSPASILASSRSKKQKPTDDDIKAAAAHLGRLGGNVGGNARANKLTSTRRIEIAKHAAMVRWHGIHPEE